MSAVRANSRLGAGVSVLAAIYEISALINPKTVDPRYAPTNAPGAYNNDPTSAAYADLSQPFKSLTGGKGAGFINTEQAANRSKDIIANLEKAGIATGQVALAASDIQTLYSQHKIKSSTDLSAPGGAWVLSETPS
jgi:hypothetical protein